MKHLLISLLILTFSFSQDGSSDKLAKEYKNDRKDINKEYTVWKTGDRQDQNKKFVADVFGAIYIKNRPLRDSVLSLIGTQIDRDEFDRLKLNIEENGKYKYPLKVSLFPLSGDSVRIEIEANRRSNRIFRDGGDMDFSYDFGESTNEYGLTQDWDGLMIDLDNDHKANDRLSIGYRAEFEHQFYRGFLGIEYAVGIFQSSELRFGMGLTEEGLFQLNYSKSDNRSSWRMSTGRITPNTRLTPQHLIVQTFQNNTLGKFDFLFPHHAFRFKIGFDEVQSAYQDTIGLKDKSKTKSYQAEYTMSYLDDNEYPLEGVYMNGKYSYSKVQDQKDDLPYKLGNDYRNDLISGGNYIESYFGNVQAMVKYNYKTALQAGLQGVYQKFNQSKYDPANHRALGTIGFRTVERQMVTGTIGIRKKLDYDEILLLNFGVNQMKFFNGLSGTIEDKFIEAKIVNSIVEFKFTYMYGQKSTNEKLESQMFHSDGFIFSIGLAFGSLY